MTGRGGNCAAAAKGVDVNLLLERAVTDLAALTTTLHPLV